MARTLLDRTGVVRPGVLRRAFDEALRRKMTTLNELSWCLARNGRRGRAQISELDTLLSDRGAFGETDSALETDVVTFLEQREFPPHVRGYEVMHRGRIVARLDFAWPKERVALLAQSTFHLSTRNSDRDQMTENLLDATGWKKVRLTARHLSGQADRIARLLWGALRRPPS